MNGSAKPWICIRIASAEFCRDSDFFLKLAEELASFLVEDTLYVLNV